MSGSHLNAAFYCFTPLTDLPSRKLEWQSRLEQTGIKGTVILAPEGINGFLAGPSETLRRVLADLRTLPELASIRIKESVSQIAPFQRLCVKVKREIVTFRQEAELPETLRITPEELVRWMDEKRDFILLDTRNRFEGRLGAFDGAIPSPIDQFVDFAAAAQEFPSEWKQKPIVTFCTGGIRCEKAAPYLSGLGFEEVYQLEDGILGYFEKVGGKHWHGECFVFDERVALDPSLKPTGARLCVGCQEPISLSGQSKPCARCGSPQL